MPFPFTFNLSNIAGLSNPFTNARRTALPPAQSLPTNPARVDSSNDRLDNKKHQNITRTRRRPSPEPAQASSPIPLSRKRGWEPAFAEPSRSTVSLASSSGYLDTPAKYREMAAASSTRAAADEFHEADMFVSDTELPPPAKRRRGLAGSIVSTAVSAALIGTAVGLTVYRLWRDRGKQPPRIEEQQSPPPPYQQCDWTQSQPQSHSHSQTPPLKITPATPTRNRRITRHHAATSSSSTRRTPTHRRTRSNRTHVFNTTPSGSRLASSPPSQTALFPAPPPQFDFSQQPTTTTDLSIHNEVEHQMDWIGDKLSMLIEEGKRALNREVVVMSDAKEDEVDDGSGAWEEEEEKKKKQVASVSRSSSLRRTKSTPRNIGPFPPYHHQHQHHHHIPSPSHSPTAKSDLTHAYMHTPPPSSRSADFNFNSTTTPSSSFRDEGEEEDNRTWESPELKESMERARARFRQSRGQR